MYENHKQALVLVIDHEPDVLANVAAALTGAGHVCHCCETAESAIEFVRTHAPDLIVSDVNLDGVSGLELCERIKEAPTLKHVPVMFLSGAQIPDIIRRTHAVGATYYLRKSFDSNVLVELVDKTIWMPHLADRRLARQPEAATAS